MDRSTEWRPVAAFPDGPEVADEAFRRLDAQLREEGIEGRRLVAGPGAWALIVPVERLLEATAEGRVAVSGLEPEDVRSRGEVLFISAASTREESVALVGPLAAGLLGASPDWLGVPAELAAAERWEHLLPEDGTAIDPPKATVSLEGSSGSPVRFQLHRMDGPNSLAAPSLRPVGRRVPEGPGNLQRRAGWFQRRTGGSR
jgi:hypothetical protein